MGDGITGPLEDIHGMIAGESQMSDDLVKRAKPYRFHSDDKSLLIGLLADRIEALETENERLREGQKKLEDAALEAGASLAAAISLLQRGGKKAAPSDKMFNQMLLDYLNSLDRLREALRATIEQKGTRDE